MDAQTSMVNKKAFRALELILATSLVAILVMSITATFVKDQALLDRWLENHRMLLGALAILECVLLLVWMGLGGQTSSLWNWLPPFCFFPKVLWVRWLVIIGLVGGTLAGMILSQGH